VTHDSNLKSTSPANKCSGTRIIQPVSRENSKVHFEHCVSLSWTDVVSFYSLQLK
jgi:ribosomal protein L14